MDGEIESGAESQKNEEKIRERRRGRESGEVEKV